MVDTIQTKEGAVPISAEAMRSSMRSMRRGKNKNIPTPSSLVTHLRSNGRKLGDGIAEMYEQFEKESHTFFAFFNAENRSKNKFPNDIFLFDRTRVILVDPPDYYHASYVDGCQQAKQYVLAQAPFDKTTASDFYRLVTQCKPELIILLMDLDSSNEAQYIISLESEVTKYGIFSIKYKKNEKIIQSKENVEKYSHYTITITWGEKNEEKYDLITFNTWVEDKVIPTQDFVKFHKSVHKLLSDKPRECSQLVVCPTGVHRAGIWTVFDMEAERLKTKNRIRFSDTIRNVRNQRCNVIEHFELFDGLLNLLVAYAKMQM